MRLHPRSRLLTLLLGAMASLPTAGIDIVLPGLSATASALDTPVVRMGLVTSAYLVGLGAAGLVWGPISDRLGRKPVIVAGCLVLAVASLCAMLVSSFAALLVFRLLQGVGACGPAGACLAMVRDIDEGEAARARLASVVMAINVLPMVAPSLGALLLTAVGWRAVYAVPLVGALALLAAMPFVAESHRPLVALQLSPAAIAGRFRDVLRVPTCRGYVLCNAAATGALFASITGSPLFFIDAAGVGPGTYGVLLGVTSLSVMLGAAISRQAARRGERPERSIAQGLALASVLAATLLLCALAGWTPIALVAFVMAGVALSFGLISPNALDGALRRDPDSVGAASAVALGAQMIGAALASDLVARFFDGHSAVSLAATLLGFCVAADAAVLEAVRPAGHRRPQARPAPVPAPRLHERS